MKKLFAFCAMMLAVINLSAQSTARKFVLKNSADGKSELTCYLPQNPTGRAVVDCPGGGYSHLAMDHEGHQWAEFFNKQGIAFFVLKYRMPNGDRNIPLGDAYQAIRTVRDSASIWHINPQDVGIMGFSPVVILLLLSVRMQNMLLVLIFLYFSIRLSRWMSALLIKAPASISWVMSASLILS